MRNENTLFIGKVVHAYEELPSTNDYARHLLAKSAPSEGTVITAGHQTAGRGQIGSNWYSAPGESLCTSVILYPRFLPAQQQYLLNLAIALALRSALQVYTENKVWVKWPNDLYLNGRKLGGILIQNTLQGKRLESSIVGFGINVNQTAFPEEAPQALSLRQATGKTFPIDQLLNTVLEKLEQHYLQLRSGYPPAQLRQAYYAHLWGYQEERRFAAANGQAFLAKITGIDETGQLRLQYHGQEKSYGLKEIRLLS